MVGPWSPVAVAVDWIGRNVYVVDELGQKIDVFDVDGMFNAIVLSSNLTSPTDLALDPTVGFMFIADSNQILRARMDGSKLMPIVTQDLYKASGVALDYVNKRVYYSDIRLEYIKTVDYNGENRQDIVKGNTFSPARLAVFERSVYWTDSAKQSVFAVDKFNGSDSKAKQTIFRNIQVRSSFLVKSHLPTTPFLSEIKPFSVRGIFLVKSHHEHQLVFCLIEKQDCHERNAFW